MKQGSAPVLASLVIWRSDSDHQRHTPDLMGRRRLISFHPGLQDLFKIKVHNE